MLSLSCEEPNNRYGKALNADVDTRQPLSKYLKVSEGSVITSAQGFHAYQSPRDILTTDSILQLMKLMIGSSLRLVVDTLEHENWVRVLLLDTIQIRKWNKVFLVI